MMMTNERKIWEAAMLLVRRHGSDAVAVAENEAERLRSDDALTCVVWCWIARSTAELLRPVPEAGASGTAGAPTGGRSPGGP